MNSICRKILILLGTACLSACSAEKKEEPGMNIPVRTADTGTFTMNYFTFGTGDRTMVILPGLSVKSVMESAQAVADEYAVMADDFTVYVFDRRTELPDTYTVYDMADDTAAVFRELGLSDVYLFGASQGGMIALALTIDHPELVHSLAIGSSAAYVDDGAYRMIGEWAELAGQNRPVELYLSFGKALYPEDVFRQYEDFFRTTGETVTEEKLKRFIITAEGSAGFDVRGRLPEINIPFLAIGSNDDAVIGAEPTLEIIEIMKDKDNFSYFMYDGYGHAAFDTAPDYRDRIYRFFMNGTD